MLRLNVFSQKTQKSPPPVDLLEGDFSYYELVKSPSVPPKGRTFIRPFLGADPVLLASQGRPLRQRPDPEYEGTDFGSDSGTG